MMAVVAAAAEELFALYRLGSFSISISLVRACQIRAPEPGVSAAKMPLSPDGEEKS